MAPEPVKDKKREGQLRPADAKALRIAHLRLPALLPKKKHQAAPRQERGKVRWRPMRPIP